MKLNKLWLNNFRTYKGEFSINFTEEPLNLITAQNNGAGKTTLFLVFYYLLIGYTSGKTQEDYINWDSDTMSCGLDLTYDNKQFIIESSLKRGKSAEKKLSIICNGNIEEFEGSNNVNKKLKEFFDPSLFLNATAIFQGSKNFTSIKDSERRDNLKKVFDIDYKDEIKGLDVRTKDLDKLLIELEKQLAILQSKKFEMEPVESFGIVTDDNIQEYNDKVDLLKKDISNIAIKLSSIGTLVEDKKNIENEIKNLIDSIDKNKNSIIISTNELNKINNYKENSKVDDFTKELSELKTARIKSFDKSLLEDKQNELSKIKTLISVDEKKLMDCKNGKCPVCGKDFTSTDTDSVEKDIEEKSNNMELLKKEIEELKEKEKEINTKIDNNNIISNRRAILYEKIDAEKNRIAKEKEYNEKNTILLSNQIKEKQEVVDSDLKLLKDKQLKLDSIIISDREDLDRNKKNLENDLQMNESLIRFYDSVKTKNKIIEESNKKKKKEEEQNRKDVKEVQEKYDKEVINKEQISKMKVFLKNEFPSYVIASMIKQIQNSMNEFISSVYYKDLNVEIKATDDNISVMYGSGNKKVDTINASGAEESLLALSYCSALNELKHYNILFIDEVDQAFTEENSQRLAEIIVDSRNNYDTIFAISHVKNTKDFYAMKGANVIYANNNA